MPPRDIDRTKKGYLPNIEKVSFLFLLSACVYAAVSTINSMAVMYKTYPFLSVAIVTLFVLWKLSWMVQTDIQVLSLFNPLVKWHVKKELKMFVQ